MNNQWKSCVKTLLFVLLCGKECYGASKVELKNENSEQFKRQMRACVIGAGYSGLGSARYMQEYGLNFTVFEATRHIGGTWRFDPHVGQDEDGLPVFTSMYKNFRTSTPRQTMEYSDFPFSEKTPTYPSGVCFYKYLERYAEFFGLRKFIQFRSLVTSVKWESDHWSLTYQKTDTKKKLTETCNFVVVGNGYYNKPKIPLFEGQHIFQGNIIHSHDYKEAAPYTNRSVLIVGARETGLDLALILSNVTSKLFLSHRRHLKHRSDDVIIKPNIERFTVDGVIFDDSSYEEIDDVIFCTGFEFDNGFLDETSGLALSPKSLMPLYQFVVNIEHPSMIFVGKTKSMFTRVFDAQAEYAAALAAGKFHLPTREVMIKSWSDHVYSFMTNGTDILQVNNLFNPDNYLKLLFEESGVRRKPVHPDYILHQNEYNTRYDIGEDMCEY